MSDVGIMGIEVSEVRVVIFGVDVTKFGFPVIVRGDSV